MKDDLMEQNRCMHVVMYYINLGYFKGYFFSRITGFIDVEQLKLYRCILKD